MPSSVTQHASTAPTTAASSVSLSFGSLPAVGATIVVQVCSADSTALTLSCADNQGGGNTYSNENAADVTHTGTDNARIRATVFRCKSVATSAGTFTVTVSGGTAGTFWILGISECAALSTSAAADASATNGANGATDPVTCTSGTTLATAQADELAFAQLCFDGYAAGTGIVTPSGFTSVALQNDGSSTLTGSCDFKVLSTTGTQSASWGASVHPGGSSPGSWSGSIITFKGASSTPANPYPDDFAEQPDVLGGADSAFAEDDQTLSLILSDSAPVRPPPAPARQTEETWFEEDFTDEPFGEDSAPVGVNAAVVQPPVVEDAWFHEDDSTDEPVGEDSAPVGPNQPARPVEEGWDWSASEDLADDQQEDDGYNVQNANVTPLSPYPVEDAWNWSEPDDLSDEPPDDDGFPARNPNPILMPANGPEDAWYADEESTEDSWWEVCLDDGFNVRNGNVIPPVVKALHQINPGFNLFRLGGRI